MELKNVLRRDEYTLWFHDFAKYEGDIIFFSGYLNALFKADTKTGKAVRIREVFSKEADCLWQYGKIYCFENRLFLFPGTGENIVMYDMKNGDFQYIYHIEKKNGLYSYFASFTLGRKIYFFGYETPEILSLNVDTYDVTSYELPKNYVANLQLVPGNPVFNRDICISGNSLYVTSARKNEVIELNLSDERVYIHQVGYEGEVYQTIAAHGSFLYLIHDDKAILKVDCNSWDEVRTTVDLSSYGASFAYSQFINDDLWLFPGCCGVPVLIQVGDFDQLLTKKIPMTNRSDDRWFPPREYQGCPMVKSYGDYLYFISGNDMCLHTFANGQEINCTKMYISDVHQKYMCKEIGKQIFYRKYLYEDMMHLPNLNDFIDYISKDIELNHQKSITQAGKIIYNEIKGISD